VVAVGKEEQSSGRMPLPVAEELRHTAGISALGDGQRRLEKAKCQHCSELITGNFPRAF